MLLVRGSIYFCFNNRFSRVSRSVIPTNYRRATGDLKISLHVVEIKIKGVKSGPCFAISGRRGKRGRESIARTIRFTNFAPQEIAGT